MVRGVVVVKELFSMVDPGAVKASDDGVGDHQRHRTDTLHNTRHCGERYVVLNVGCDRRRKAGEIAGSAGVKLSVPLKVNVDFVLSNKDPAFRASEHLCAGKVQEVALFHRGALEHPVSLWEARSGTSIKCKGGTLHLFERHGAGQETGKVSLVLDENGRNQMRSHQIM